LILAILAAVLSPASAVAQRFGLEVRGGGAVGSYTATAAGLDVIPALSFGAALETRVSGPFSAYVGLSRSSFGCEEGFCAGRDVSLTSQGLVAGARWGPGLPWIRAGLALQNLRLTADGEEETSDLGVGWDLAGGIDVTLADRFHLRPGLTYLRHAAATVQGDGHVALLALELGVAVGLGGIIE
jgi:hypothetical protein